MKGKIEPPIKVGDEVRIKIEALGAKGDGIAKISNFVLFVKNVEVEKEYNVKIDRVLDSYAFGSVLE